MYIDLLSRQTTAIQNAKRLAATYGHQSYASRDPFTTVHELVEELNRLL